MEQVFDLQKEADNWWFLQSTASAEIDVPPAPSPGPPTDVEKELDGFVDAVVARVLAGGSPNVTIFSHGFNSDLKAVQDRITSAQKRTRQAPLNDPNLFWIGYRWPSEAIFSARSGTFRAAHPAVRFKAALSLLMLVAGVVLKADPAITASWSALARLVVVWGLLIAGWGVLAFLAGFAALRASVYFRDAYRCVHYGALDLVEFVRRLDSKLYSRLQAVPNAARVDISLIGHSMGGLVVTTAIRILSDVFDPDSILPMTTAPTPPAARSPDPALERVLSGQGDLSIREVARDRDPGPHLGSSLSLLRFVLVSPDIPALALVTGRANFLGPSIRRCSEAYLVSNGGDVVLSLISNAANYLEFPAHWYRNSARLGNVQVLSTKPGVFPPLGQVHDSLRVGPTTLRALEQSCVGAIDPRFQVAQRFTYVDCTGFSDQPGHQPLSYLKGIQQPTLFRQIQGLLGYLAQVAKPGWGKDCHSGYFDFDDTLLLIFGCAGLGLLTLKARLEAAGANVDSLIEERGFRICPGEGLGTTRTKAPLGRQ